jgi:nitrite reductase (NADH) small subunit/3-phenylpropionate/trans-cinnamate dioxygenase ferredoxin subunit
MESGNGLVKEDRGVGQRVIVCSVEDIPEGGSAVVTLNQKDIAIFNVKGAFFAIDDVCPHMGASLSGGHVEDGCVTCPWHHWRFRLCDGAWADSPKVKTGNYPVHVVDNQIQIEMPSVTSGEPAT